MEWVSTVAAIMLVHWVAVIVPGPNTLIVSTVAMKETRGRGVATALGIGTGTVIWSVASMTGLALALQHAPTLFRALQAMGGLYLIYIAYGLLRAAFAAPVAALATDTNAVVRAGLFATYQRGLTTSITNPKAAIYFLGIFGVGIGADTPTWVRIVIVGACVAISLGWYTILALLLSTARAQRSYLRLQRPIDFVAGATFGGFGVLMLVAVVKAIWLA